jgi:uncharacterized coiled-coil protein SlyX
MPGLLWLLVGVCLAGAVQDMLVLAASVRYGGQSLAAIARAEGKSVDGLKAALVADAKADLDQAVTDGKLTSAQESQMLSDLTSRIGDLVNATGLPPGPHAGAVFRVGPPAAIADYLGLTEDELRTQLAAGKSLAAVAEAQGKSVEGLEAAMLADAKAHLDAVVAAGQLSADREQQMLDELKSRLDDIVNRTGPPPGPGAAAPA